MPCLASMGTSTELNRGFLTISSSISWCDSGCWGFGFSQLSERECRLIYKTFASLDSFASSEGITSSSISFGSSSRMSRGVGPHSSSSNIDCRVNNYSTLFNVLLLRSSSSSIPLCRPAAWDSWRFSVTVLVSSTLLEWRASASIHWFLTENGSTTKFFGAFTPDSKDFCFGERIMFLNRLMLGFPPDDGSLSPTERTIAVGGVTWEDLSFDLAMPGFAVAYLVLAAGCFFCLSTCLYREIRLEIPTWVCITCFGLCWLLESNPI